VFMSSHVLPEVERVCDRIGLLRRGELVLLAHVDEVRALAGRRARVTFTADVLPPRLPPDCEGIEILPRLWDVRVRGPMGPLERNQAFATLSSIVPEFIRSVAGPSMLAFMSFGGIVALGYFHPIVLASLLGLAIAIATEPAAEIESRFDDLTLTRPVPRRAII